MGRKRKRHVGDHETGAGHARKRFEVGDFCVCRENGKWWPATVQKVHGVLIDVMVGDDWPITANKDDILQCPCAGHHDTTVGPFMQKLQNSLGHCCVEHIQAIFNLWEYGIQHLEQTERWDEWEICRHLLNAKGDRVPEILGWLVNTHGNSLQVHDHDGKSVLHAAAENHNLAGAFAAVQILVADESCNVHAQDLAALLTHRDDSGRLHTMIYYMPCQ